MGAGANEIRAGKASIELGVNDAGLRKGLEDAKARLAGFGSALQSLGSALALSFVTTKIKSWVESFAEGGSAIYVMARTAQIGTEELLELKSAIAILGGDLDGTVKSMRHMAVFLAEFAGGGREAEDVMRRLGLTMADVNKLSESDKLQLIGERLAAIGNADIRVALGRKIFGREGGATVGLAAGLGGAREKARGSGLQSEGEIKAAFELSQAIAAYNRAKQKAFEAVGAALAPAFTLIYNRITPVITGIRDWIRANAILVQKVGIGIAIFAGLSAGILALSAAVGLGLWALGTIAAVVGGLAAVFGYLLRYIVFSLSPWGILIELAKQAFVYFLRVSGILDSLMSLFAKFGQTISLVAGAIVDAIKAGEIEAAWHIAVQGMKVAWVDFQIWFRNSFGVSVREIFDAVKVGWIETMAFMKTAWVATSGFLAGISNWSQNAQTDSQIRMYRERSRPNRTWYDRLNWGSDIAPDVAEATINQLRRSQAEENAGGADAAEFRRQQLIQIEADRRRARAGIANAPREDLLGDANVAQQRLDELRDEAEMLAAHAAHLRQSEAENAIQPGLDEYAQKNDSARGTFNRDVLFGFGATPIQQLADIGREQLRVNGLILERVIQVLPLRVG